MNRNATHARAIIEVWLEQGADRMDPVRFHRIDALERRAAGQDGEVRRLLDGRLSELIGAYADDLEGIAAESEKAVGAAAPRASAGTAVGELVDYIAGQAAKGDAGSAAGGVAPAAAFPELGALDDFRKLWSRIRAESQLRQSLEPASTDAGPLNSGKLVHRSLTLMRELSPGYLQQFLSYVDALAWLGQMNDGAARTTEEAPRSANGGKRIQGRTRGRRD